MARSAGRAAGLLYMRGQFPGAIPPRRAAEGRLGRPLVVTPLLIPPLAVAPEDPRLPPILLLLEGVEAVTMLSTGLGDGAGFEGGEEAGAVDPLEGGGGAGGATLPLAALGAEVEGGAPALPPPSIPVALALPPPRPRPVGEGAAGRALFPSCFDPPTPPPSPEPPRPKAAPLDFSAPSGAVLGAVGGGEGALLAPVVFTFTFNEGSERSMSDMLRTAGLATDAAGMRGSEFTSTSNMSAKRPLSPPSDR